MDNIFEGFSLTGLNFPAKTQESDLYCQKIPTFCPKCEEIRGAKSGCLINALYWASFGMCELCYQFQRDHPEEAIENQKTFDKKQEEKRQAEIESAKAHCYRVFIFEPNEKLPTVPFATSVTNIKFTRYPSKTSRGLANHSILLVTKEEAEKTLEILTKKDIICWYEKIDFAIL